MSSNEPSQRASNRVSATGIAALLVVFAIGSREWVAILGVAAALLGTVFVLAVSNYLTPGHSFAGWLDLRRAALLRAPYAALLAASVIALAVMKLFPHAATHLHGWFVETMAAVLTFVALTVLLLKSRLSGEVLWLTILEAFLAVATAVLGVCLAANTALEHAKELRQEHHADDGSVGSSLLILLVSLLVLAVVAPRLEGRVRRKMRDDELVRVAGAGLEGRFQIVHGAPQAGDIVLRRLADE